ncbi:hypothetical protein L1987_58546 [Smallanthus sonchifolius]|uniref:Uncharacterized protein n=1 Tax=Smallanthus sonchifolius TaxID=185202 RepID=A0ACB9DFI5_9ASTR|nr:hypothetical protein L1987_58546 [Smallanthus sonchifolius]
MGRFWRMAEAFEVASKVRDWDSSIKHLPETKMDLSALVNSFIQNGNGVANRDFDTKIGDECRFCKSKWEKKGRLLAGDHEYIDVNVANTRYIVIISFFEEFKIARPTNNYASLLEILPTISVSKVEDFKETVKIMSRAMKKSMNQMKMPVPPWRRHEYVQAKWFGAYKRTTKDLKVINKKSIGFISIPDTCYGRRLEEFARKDFGYKMGNSAMAMNGAI